MATELPASVKPFAGRLTDVDSHEQVPAQKWVETFGELMRPFADIKLSQQPRGNRNHPNVEGYTADVLDLTPENVWLNKGPSSPGALDVRRRLDVLDLMQISRQLMYPTAAGLYGMTLYTAPEGSSMYKMFGDQTYEMGRKMIQMGNEWMVASARISDRVRPVASIYGETPAEIISVAKSLLDQGIKALMVSPGRLPGGVSPAHSDLDPLYAMLSEAKVPLTMHIGSELLFFRTMGWGEAKAFEGFKINDEISMDPWRLSAMAIPPQNFVATMVTGGVFDRHPELRVGVIEFGANFIGPLADLLDFWHDNNQSIEPSLFADGNAGRRLPMRPSDYIKRNVRVSPFDIEPVGAYIEKYGLEDVYCFATDYPHVEGGKDPINRFAESLSAHGQGAKVFEKFFVTNGEWLLPA
jgi:predicted TIM-barrel fold metal-dependent hydrolase